MNFNRDEFNEPTTFSQLSTRGHQGIGGVGCDVDTAMNDRGWPKIDKRG